jgi:hypothetical protein
VFIAFLTAFLTTFLIAFLIASMTICFFKNDFSFYVYSNFVAAIGWIRIQLLRKFSGSGSILISYGGDKGNISSKSDPDSEH